MQSLDAGKHSGTLLPVSCYPKILIGELPDLRSPKTSGCLSAICECRINGARRGTRSRFPATSPEDHAAG